jgi:cytochrome o ubiquinol oxidase subunit 1
LIGAAAFLAGFGIVWHIWWLAIFAIIAGVACVFVRTFDDDTEHVISAAEVARLELHAV